MQMMCAIIGSMAFMGVRRQKRSTASLFDQRKLGPDATAGTKRSSDAAPQEGGIEFRNIRMEEEAAPLIQGNSHSLEII